MEDYRPLTFLEIMNRPSKEYLVEGLIGKGDIGMMYGQSGTGKTFVTLDMLICCALGQTWANQFEVNRPMVVAYAFGEGGGGLADRYRALASHYNVDNVENFFAFEQPPQLFSKHGRTEHVKKFVSDWRSYMNGLELDLLVLDTLHTVSEGADENSARDSGIILSSMRYIRDELGCAIFPDHHTGKNGLTERGSSAYRGAMDFMIRCENMNGGGVVTVNKLKDGRSDYPPIGYSITPFEDSAIVQWQGEVNPQKLPNKAEQYRSTILKWMKDNAYDTNGKTIGDIREGTSLDLGNYMHKLLNQLAEAGSLYHEGEGTRWDPKRYFVVSEVTVDAEEAKALLENLRKKNNS